MASGKPTNSEARSFHNRFDRFGDVLKPAQYGGPTRPVYAELDNEPGFIRDHPRYPAFQYPDDKEADTRFEAMQQSRMMMGTNAMYVIGDKDADYVLRKKEARALVDFKQFVEDSIPRGTPWAREYFEKIMPGWYQTRIDIINQKLDIVQRLVEITVRGPQSIDDMFLLYQIYQGNIAIPGNFQDLITGGNDQGIAAARFHAGLYNPKRFDTKKMMISSRNQQFLANFAIPGINLKGITEAGHNNTQAWGNRPVRMRTDNTNWITGNDMIETSKAVGWQEGNGDPGGDPLPALNTPLREAWMHRSGQPFVAAAPATAGAAPAGFMSRFAPGSLVHD